MPWKWNFHILAAPIYIDMCVYMGVYIEVSTYIVSHTGDNNKSNNNNNSNNGGH